MAKRRYKLKKNVKIGLILFVLLLGVLYLYNDFRYKSTYEYKLTQIGYSLKEVKLLKENFNENKLDYLVSTQKKDTILIEVLKNTFYKKENHDRYIDYINKHKYDTDKAINEVNINLDYPFYSLNINTDINKKKLMIVNKYYILNSDYIPENLVNVSSDYSWGTNNQLDKEAFENFKIMHTNAKEDGIYLMINSAYRSYNDQEKVYNHFKNKYNEEDADKLAARPGSSEHQTGLAIDVFSTKDTTTGKFATSETYLWLKNNSYKYGYILRYPEEKENITGYVFESWHYRYVGIKDAKKIYDLKITFDEYYGNYLS
ncbi:MAG: M15 family metallopeptidase [Mollicutes bacterium]|nr:M15 family metallopeptidase [Mollicutes bacterium]